MLGYPTASVYYDRKERFAGESKYPFTKMLNFALDGITSFSVKPLRLITTSGLIFMLVSFLAIIYALVEFIGGDVIRGLDFATHFCLVYRRRYPDCRRSDR